MATYYIDPAGLDDAGEDGSIAEPWKTLSYACTRATTAGDTIHVNAGNYLENTPCSLAVGVSIVGEGEGSFIYSNDTDTIMLLDSAVENTPGNQSISYCKFSGEAYANDVCMYINGRGNVEIHHCWFEEFRIGAIRFKGNLAGDDIEPGTYSKGNKVHDCSFNDCARRVTTNGYGSIQHGGQDGLLIYNNTIIQEAAGNENGYFIKYIDFGHSKNVKIYDNYMRRTVDDGYFAIGIEAWNGEGGNEIYNNTMLGGCVNIAGTYAHKGLASYSFDVHHNTLGLSAIGSAATYQATGVVVEGGAEDVYVHHNLIKNVGTNALSCSVGQAVTMKRIYFDYNIVHNWGSTADDLLSAVGLVVRVAGSKMQDVYFRNNVLFNDKVEDPRYVVFFNPKEGDYTNINFINNICMGAKLAWMQGIVQAGAGIINLDQLKILNNIIYDNGNNTYAFGAGITVTNDVETGTINSDPLFVSSSDFNLQPDSPAIDKGIDVGLTSDFIGTLIVGDPDIGAYEWYEIVYDFAPITLINTPACYNPADPSIISRWVATECPINFTLLRRDYYVINCVDSGGFLAINIYGTFAGNDNDVISVYDLTTNSMYTGTITDSSGDPVLITDIPYVAGMDIKYLNDHTLHAGYYFEGRLTINGVFESLTVIASPDSLGYADLDVSGILRIKTSIGKVTNYLSLIQKDYNKSGRFTLEYRGCWYGSDEPWISEGSATSPVEDIIWYYAECVRSEEQGCNLAEYVPSDLNDAPFLNQFDTPVYWYGLPFDLSFILPERSELSPTSDITVTMKVYNSNNIQVGGDITQTIPADQLEGYVNSLNVDSTLIPSGVSYFTVEITAV